MKEKKLIFQFYFFYLVVFMIVFAIGLIISIFWILFVIHFINNLINFFDISDKNVIIPILFTSFFPTVLIVKYVLEKTTYGIEIADYIWLKKRLKIRCKRHLKKYYILVDDFKKNLKFLGNNYEKSEINENIVKSILIINEIIKEYLYKNTKK